MASHSHDGYGADRPLCHIITPVGMLGYGFDEPQTRNELGRLVSTGVATAIILDSGSTDSGPQKLALGSMSCPRSAYHQDLTKLLRLLYDFRVPLIFGSTGGDGTDEHVLEIGEVVKEITDHNPEYLLKVISIFSSIDKDTILTRWREGRISGCGPCVPPLTETDIRDSPRVVAQLGPEPFIDAMEAEPDFDVIIGGRAYDPAPYAAYCVHQLKQQDPEISEAQIRARLGGFLHMGKIMECGGQCAFPKSHGAVATVYANGVFDVRPTAPDALCTPMSVAAHALYENTRPDILRGPGGSLLLDDTKYESLPDGRSVRVRGSVFRSSGSEGKPYQLKLEAARIVGYRSITLGSIKDPILIKQLHKMLPLVKKYVSDQHQSLTAKWDLDFHIYGNDKSSSSGTKQLFVVTEAVAETQQLASSLASKARVAMIHAPYPSQKATSGNLGFGIGGLMEIETGPCAEFSLYHLMSLEPGEERLTWKEDSDVRYTNKPFARSSVMTIGGGSHKVTRPPLEPLSDISRPTSNQKPSAGPSSHPVQLDQTPAPNPKTLADICRVLRSKNAGPYEITVDAMFYTQADYERVKSSGFLSHDRVARALGIGVEDIIWIGFSDPAQAFKVTFPRVRRGRRTSAGGFMEDDVHGSQEHTGLTTLLLSNGASGSVTEMVKSLILPAQRALWWRFIAAVVAGLGLGHIASMMTGLRKRVQGRSRY